MSTPIWNPGTQYLPGAIVTPRSNNVVINVQPNNNSFEDGMTHWTVTGLYCSDSTAQNAVSASTAESFDGTQSAYLEPTEGNGSGPRSGSGNPAAFAILTNDFAAEVVPGQIINFSAHVYTKYGDPNQSYCSAGPQIAWYNEAMEFISYSFATSPQPNVNAGGTGLYGAGNGPNEDWVTVSGKGVAPSNAKYAVACITMTTTNYATQAIYVDYYTWDYTEQGYPAGLVFVAVQPTVGTSGSVEPAWPATAGVTVVDNTVTWEAEYASSITWTASSILMTGADEPTWPTQMGASVIDNDIIWTATDGRITDPNCPQSKIVSIASAKIYAADDDIIRFSATANAQDWSSSQDAGYIPFGLQAYGNEPCEGLGLYRSNLVAFNSLGYQMWQVDADPNNIAILDAEPVGCNYSKSIQPVNNDLVFLSPVGIRNIGTSGASGNLQAGQFGKAVDPIVLALINTLTVSGYEPRSLFNPGTGQYWLLIGDVAIVLSINGNNSMSWSRYEFPGVITDWTVQDGVLYLRAGDLVWECSASALTDDTLQTTAEGGDNVGFDGAMSWNYIETGQLGVDQMMEGFDLTVGEIDDYGLVTNNTCEVAVSFGYNQSNREMATEPFQLTGDSIPGTMIPMPLVAPSFQPRLDFGTGQNWGWGALNLYTKELAKP